MLAVQRAGRPRSAGGSKPLARVVSETLVRSLFPRPRRRARREHDRRTGAAVDSRAARAGDPSRDAAHHAAARFGRDPVSLSRQRRNGRVCQAEMPSPPRAFSRALMISLSKVSKQYGRQLIFVDASFQLNPGEKAGLVGPNGAGKTTLFRLIVGEESPDEGEVSVPKKVTIG